MNWRNEYQIENDLKIDHIILAIIVISKQQLNIYQHWRMTTLDALAEPLDDLSCWRLSIHTMTSCHRNDFSITGHLRGESTDHLWFPSQIASNARYGDSFLMFLNKLLKKSRIAGDLRRHGAQVTPL